MRLEDLNELKRYAKNFEYSNLEVLIDVPNGATFEPRINIAYPLQDVVNVARKKKISSYHHRVWFGGEFTVDCIKTVMQIMIKQVGVNLTEDIVGSRFIIEEKGDNVEIVLFVQYVNKEKYLW